MFLRHRLVRHFKSKLKEARLPEETRIHDLWYRFISWLLAFAVPPRDVQVFDHHH